MVNVEEAGLPLWEVVTGREQRWVFIMKEEGCAC